MYTDSCGVLEVFPKLTSRTQKGDLVAHLHNVFGDVIAIYKAPEDGVVVGKSTDPISRTGSRILHLGIVDNL